MTSPAAASEVESLRARVAVLEQSVQERTRQLDVAVKELADFAHSMSHDLRAPLRGIAGFTRMLAEDHGPKLDDEGRRLLQSIRDEAGRMAQHIDDLVMFARAGRQQIDAAEIEMADLAQSAFQQLTEASPGTPPEFVVHALPRALGDRAMVRQVFTHLIANAIKFSARQAAPRIAITGEPGPDGARYTVTDNGVGFDQRYAHKLFHVFQRLHRIGEFPGSGVGLAVVQRIVLRHGGRVWAEGRVNEGASFHFTLPAAGPDAGAKP